MHLLKEVTSVTLTWRYHPCPTPTSNFSNANILGEKQWVLRGCSLAGSAFRSDQISRSVVTDSLQPHESQHTRPPYPSPTPEFTQTQAHRVSDAIQPSHPLSSPSPPDPNPSQPQSLFQWVNSLHEAAKVLEFQLQHHSLQINPRADLLQNGLVGSTCSPWDSQESSSNMWLVTIKSLI